MLNFGFKRRRNRIPRESLLLYLGRPNLEAADVPIGDDTEIGDDTIIRWMFLLPADADIRTATGWVSGVGNIFYDAAGDPVAVFASEIAAWANINRYNVLFHLVSADTETGRLAIYALDAEHATLNKARRVLREDQYDYWVPLGAILHYDAEVSPLTELFGGAHTLNHAVLNPQYQRLADGRYINVGAQPAIDVLAGGIKGLRSCGAITNLFPGDTSVARAVALIAQTYTLQVIGAGTVSCSYGTATVGSPLTFTATVGTTTFTPSGATLWILTATAYPTPYVPPGVTQPASNATASNGPWLQNPDESGLWNSLDGAPGGVQLVNNGDCESALMSTSPAINLFNTILSKSQDFAQSGLYSAKLTDSLPGSSVAHYLRPLGANGVGATVGIYVTGWVYIPLLLATDGLKAVDTTDGSVVKLLTNVRDTWVPFKFKRPAKGSAWTFGLGNNLSQNWAGRSMYFDNISIKYLYPQPITNAVRIKLGVGDADLPNNSTLNVCTPDDVSGRFLTIQKSAMGTLTANLSDGTNTATVTLVPWSSWSTFDFYLQVITAANQMRVGYKLAASGVIIWGELVTYDGSFNPDATLERMMLGYNNPYPIWYEKITAWPMQVSDVVLLEAWA